MIINTLSLQHFRCFPAYQTALHPRFNYIIGQNGVGKTALLEAISLACTAHSFRVREIAPLIHFEGSELTIVAQLSAGQTIGVKKSREAATTIKVNGQSCFKTSELAALIPSQVIYQDLFQIIDAGPMVRRQLLDWGMFHVEHCYHDWWCQYKQGLKQRNALLKQAASASEIMHWDKTLSELAEKMDKARQAYVETLTPLFKQFSQSLTPLICDMHYYNGWDRERSKPLWETLRETYETDRLRQYTQFGPHHADLEIQCETGAVRKYLSRGQQKMVLLSLKLAQAACLGKPCIYIWDDICSELDVTHLQKLGELIQTIPGQYFISGIHVHASPLAQFNQGAVIELK